MKFNPTNLRSLGDDHKYSLGIRASRLSPLLLVKSTGEVEFAVNLTDKDRLVANFNEKKDLLVWAWAGQYRTDMFSLTKQDLDRHYR